MTIAYQWFSYGIHCATACWSRLINPLSWKPADATYAIQVDYVIENTEEKNFFLGYLFPPGPFQR